MEGLRRPYEDPTITETEISEDEKKREREKILQKLDQALEALKRVPEGERSVRQQWIISSVEASRAKVGLDGRFEVSAAGMSQREGIPVDGLIEEVSGAEKAFSDFLNENSKGYFELRPEMTGDKQHPRTEYEAKLVSSDHRATGSMEGDYALAMEEMSKRRELVLPVLASKEEEVSKPKDSGETEKSEGLDFKKARLVDLSEVVKAMAWREAEQKMRNVLDDKRKSNFIKRAWVRLGEKGYLMKFYKEALDEMKNNRNLLAEIETRIWKRSKGEIKTGTKETTYEILDSFLDEYDKELTDADEKGEVVVDAGVNQAASELFADFATGKITSREDFDKEVESRIVPLLKGRKFTAAAGRDKEAVGLMYANNFWELAQNFKAYLDKKVAEYGPESQSEILEHIKGEMALDLELGLKQRDLFETKPQEALKWYEKFVDKTQSIPILNKIVANPVAYGLIGGVAGTFVGRGITRATAVAGLKAGAGLVGMAGAAPWLAPILAGMGFGGLYVAARRSRDLSYDRGMDLRRATLGAEVGGKRTEKMREFQYDHKKAEELIAGLKTLSVKGELATADKDSIAEIIARLQVEKSQSVDLIGVEAEEGSKYKTKAIGMKDLKWELKTVQEKFKLTDEELKPLVDNWTTEFLKNIKAKDQAFDKYRHKEMAKAGVIGALMGLGAGALAQHVTYMIRGGETESALSHLWHVIKGDTQDFPQALHEVPIIIPGTHDQIPIKIPEGTILRQLGDHFELVSKDGDKVIDVFVNQDGSLAEKTLAEAADRGFQVQDHVETVARTISPLDHFKDQLGEHARVDWHDELGPRYSSFFNKLIEFEGKQQMLYLEKGADGNVFVNAEGIARNLIKNVEGAFKEFGTNPDGSVDSKLAHLRDQLLQWDQEGTLAKHLQVAIIPTEEANQKGLSMLVDGANDRFHLALPKEVSDMFKTPESLKYLHHPLRFIEVRIGGHTLATSIGGDMPPIETSVPLHHPEIIPPIAHGWEPPPVLPFYPRKPLEAKGYKKPMEYKKPIVGPLPLFDAPVSVGDYYGGYSYESGQSYNDAVLSGKLGDKAIDVRHYFSDLEQNKPKLSKSDIRKELVSSRDDGESKYIVDHLDDVDSDGDSIDEWHEKYRKRYGDDISREGFKKKITETYLKMWRNLKLEKSKVGDRPFNKEFYKNSPVIQGINNADEIVIMFDPPLGDTILDLPLITSLERYLRLNNLHNKKKITIVTKHNKLLIDFEAANPSIKVINDSEVKDYFAPGKKRYIFNDNKEFRGPEVFGLSEDEFKDEKNVLNIHYSSWSLEQVPDKKILKGKMSLKPYYPIPARVMRNMELMLGTKLFDDIMHMDSFWPPVADYIERRKNKLQELGINEQDPIVGISFGSSIMPKEYEPSRWIKTLEDFCSDAPENTQFVILEDPNADKFSHYKSEVIDQLSPEIKKRIHIVKMDMGDASLLMKMFRVFVSPDTGLGHLAASLGTPNVALHINNPALWSSAKSRRVIGEPGLRAFRRGERDYGEAWDAPGRFTNYRVVDRSGKLEGASNIDPKRVADTIRRAFKETFQKQKNKI